MSNSGMIRTRWAAVGAAVAVTLGAVGLGGLNIASAGVSSGDRPVFIPIDPCRLVDTRPSATVGPKTSPLGPGETYSVTAHGENGDCTGASEIPTDAVALALNVTAVAPSADTFLTFWGGGANPGTSNLNPRAGGAPTPNSVNTPLTDIGTFNIYNDAGNLNVIVDVNGYYADHDHDDRYYTETESDDRYYTEAESDDRYYTETESDARYAPAGADLTPVNIFSYDFDPTSNWASDQVLQHDPTGSAECVTTPLDLPVGRTVSGLSISYIANAGADIQVLIFRTLNKAGSFTTEAEIIGAPIPDVASTLPVTPPNTVASVTVDAPVPEIVESGASYFVSICTADDLIIIGTAVNTPLL